jgi:uncharacterized protein (TIGR00106 family)
MQSIEMGVAKMAIVQVSIAPLGTKTTSISNHVARALKVLQRQKSVKYKLTPMGTVLEGDLDKVLRVVRKMHESLFEEGVQRVVTFVNIDDRRDKRATMESKIRSVEDKLCRS